MSETRKITSTSENRTLEIGRAIGTACVGSELICLVGPLGSGKSVLARGIARGLGIEGPVRSPSFNLMREYSGRLIFRHWDLYRLDGGFESLGFHDSVGNDCVVVVEWAERWKELEEFCTGRISLEYGDKETDRILEFAGSIPGIEKILK